MSLEKQGEDKRKRVPVTQRSGFACDRRPAAFTPAAPSIFPLQQLAKQEEEPRLAAASHCCPPAGYAICTPLIAKTA